MRLKWSRTVFPQKAIPRATLLLLRRSAGPLSSIVLAGDGDGRGARLLGGRVCLALGRRSRSSFVSPAASSSPARVRSRVYSSSFGGGARLCPGDFGVAEELTALWNKVSWPCLRPNGVLLRRLRRGRRVMHRRPGLALHRLCQVTFVLPFLLLLDMEVPVGSVDGGRLDLGAGWIGTRSRSMEDRRWLNPIFDDGCQFRLHSKPVCDGIRPTRGVARLLRRRRWSTATMSSTEVSQRCQGPLCNFSLVWASL